MFPKGDQARVNETLNFIRGYGAIPALVRNDIALMVSAAYPRTTPLQQQAYHTLSLAMSVKTGATVPPGNDQQRMMRRAIVLIWQAMSTKANDPAPVRARGVAAMGLGIGFLAAALDDAMLKAAVVASPAGAAHVFLNEFATHPQRFLRVHRIFARGSTAGRQRFEVAGGPYTNVMNFSFYYEPGFDRFELAVIPLNAAVGPGYVFATVSVPAVHWSDVPGVAAQPGNFAGVLATELSGASYMVTTQFTGCSFCFKGAGQVMHAAHISPAGDVNKVNYVGAGTALANRIVNHGGAFANVGGAAALNVFGNGAGNAVLPAGGNGFYPVKTAPAQAGFMKWMTVFGLRKNGVDWRIYTQSVDGVDAIMPGSVRRLI